MIPFRRPWMVAVLLAAAATAVLAPTSAPARAAENMDIAVQDEAVLLNKSYFDRTAAYALLRDMNASRVRFNAIWASLNRSQSTLRKRPQKPVYDFGKLDEAIEVARSQGMKVQLTITGQAPAWASGDKKLATQGTVKPNAKLYARFVRTVVTRYKGRVDAYSIWNEPNHKGWLQPVRQGPALYRKLYEAAYPVIRKVDPAAKILIAETAPYPSKKGNATPPLRFLRDLACVDKGYKPLKGKKCKPLVADAYAHHPYDYTRPPNRAYPGADNVSMGGLSRLENALNRLARRKRLVNPEGGALNLWLTEFGYFARKETGREKVYSESKRAKYLVKAFQIAQKDPRVEVMLQFLLVEYPKGMFRFNTSIVSLNGKPKRTYKKLASWGRKAGKRGQVSLPGPIIPPAQPTPTPAPTPTPQPEPTPPPPDCTVELPPLPVVCP
jgi:Cellulase (glycosyl hydrolase family 5)